MKLASKTTILGLLLLPLLVLADWPVKPPSDADPDTVAVLCLRLLDLGDMYWQGGARK